jgi:hypothetical protein
MELSVWLAVLLSLPGALAGTLEIYEWLRKRKKGI